VASAAGVAVAPGNYEALRCDAASCTSVALVGAKFVYIAPVLATAGFYPTSPLPQPKLVADVLWARLTNVTGLVSGVTKLGDELSLLYPWNSVTSSVFAGMLNQVWNGSAFADPG
jgi:hypothetical protein